MIQDRKLHAKNEEAVLCDYTGKEFPEDDFKKVHCRTVHNKDLYIKPNEVHIEIKEDKNKKHNDGSKKFAPQRWSTLESKFNRAKKRIFDELPNAILSGADTEAMYSSFNPKGVFVENS